MDDVVIATTEPTAPVARAALEAYFAELAERFVGGFEVGSAFDDAATMFTPPAGAFVVVTAGGPPLGCGGLSRVDPRTAEIKRMWVSPAVRGLGLGRRILGRLEAIAAEAGATRVVLDTNEVLLEAMAMYRACGYHEIGRYNDNPDAHHWFAKELTGAASATERPHDLPQ